MTENQIFQLALILEQNL